MKIRKKLETLINTGFQLGNTWQHPKSPQNEDQNIAETPKNAASALLEASLGEDKYLIYLAYLWLICRGLSAEYATSSKEGDSID